MSVTDGMEDERKLRSFGSISDAANGKLDDKEEKRNSFSLLSKNMTLPELSTQPTTMGKGECLVPVMPGSKDQQRTINEGEFIVHESG
jgi:hypothetical protein